MLKKYYQSLGETHDILQAMIIKTEKAVLKIRSNWWRTFIMENSKKSQTVVQCIYTSSYMTNDTGWQALSVCDDSAHNHKTAEHYTMLA